MKESASNIDVALSTAREKESGSAIYHDAYRCHDHDGNPGNGLRTQETLDGFKADSANRDQKENCICESGKNGCSAEAIGKSSSRSPFLRDRCTPSDYQTKDITKIMTGIGHKRR